MEPSETFERIFSQRINIGKYFSLFFFSTDLRQNMVDMPVLKRPWALHFAKVGEGFVTSQWEFGVKMTSYQGRCDVITSHRR